MRALKSNEVKHLLTVLSKQLFNAGLIQMDNICYGSIEECSKSGKEYRFLIAVLDAVPEDVRKQYNAEILKEKANKLREQADKIERGQVK